MAICMFMQNFVSIGRTVAEILQIFDFQYGGRPPSWLCEMCKFQHHARFTAKICLFIQNFITIDWTVAESYTVIAIGQMTRNTFCGMSICPTLTYKSLHVDSILVTDMRKCPVFEIFEVKRLWIRSRTVQCHSSSEVMVPIDSAWVAFYSTSVRVTVFEIFDVKF